MEDINYQVSRVQAAINSLENECHDSEISCSNAEREAHKNLNESGSIISEMKNDLSAAYSELDYLDQSVSSGIVETRKIGQTLAKLFRQVAQILEEIRNKEQKGDKIEKLLSITWDNTQKSIQKYSNTYDNWSVVNQKIVKQKTAFDSIIHSMEIQFENMRVAQEAMYRIIREFTRNRFEIACHAYNELGIEAFFYDKEDRFARLNLQRVKDAETTKELILGIDLKLLDEEKREVWAEKIRQVILKSRKKEKRVEVEKEKPATDIRRKEKRETTTA